MKRENGKWFIKWSGRWICIADTLEDAMMYVAEEEND